MRGWATGLAVIWLAAAGSAEAQRAAMSDAQIREQFVAQSIASYSGSCPCPYSRCGGRSGYSRPGGAVPQCYASDVSQAAVDAYRRSRSIPRP